MTAIRTILLLGNYRPTLALARSLGAAGHRVIVGLEGCDRGAEYSRYTSQVWDHPSLKDDETAFLNELEAFVREHNVSLIIPVEEGFIGCFIRNQSKINRMAPVAMVEPRLTSLCLDKIAMMQRCVRLNVPCAPFAKVSCVADLRHEIDRLGYPVVVRSERSTCRLDGLKAISIDTASDIERLIAVWPISETDLIVQKRAEGRRYNVYFAARAGIMLQHVQAAILRTDNPDGSGLAVEGETRPARQDLRAYTEALLQDLSYDGIGCAQFLVDEASNQICFLEINARIAGNLIVPEAAGLKLIEFHTEPALSGAQNNHVVEGRHGMRYVWTSGELMAAIVAQSRGEISTLEFFRRCLRAVGRCWRADLHMVFAWSDPLPAIMTILRMAPSLSGLRRRLKSLLGNSCATVEAQKKHPR